MNTSSGPDQAKAKFLSAARAEPSPTRQEVMARDRRVVLGAVAVTGLVFLAAGGPHWASRGTALVVSTVVAWGLVAALATSLALRRGKTMLGWPRSALLGGTIAVPALLAISWFAMPSPIVLQTIPHAAGADWQCLGVTLALGAAPLAAFFVLRRDGDPISPGVTGAMLGAAAGAWGSMLIDLHCEFADPRHVVVGHLLPVAVLSVAAALAARSVLAVRRHH